MIQAGSNIPDLGNPQRGTGNAFSLLPFPLINNNSLVQNLSANAFDYHEVPGINGFNPT